MNQENEETLPTVGPVPVPPKRSRREFLYLLGGTGAVVAAFLSTGHLLKHKSGQVAQKINSILPKVTKPLPPLPMDPGQSISGLSPLVTPTKDFYRIDIAMDLPAIDLASWKLTITGMVKKPITLTYAELIKRPLFELDDTMSCVSNPVGGILIGNARWLGARLDDLINEAEPLESADQILSTGKDGFTSGFPLSTLDGRDAMIAIGMNGAVLPVENGYPARIVVPGLYGYVSATKWLTNIELTRFDIKQGYWIPQGWAELGPVKMESRIDVPKGGATVQPGETFIAGVAWAPIAGIEAVEVKIDNGPWLPATLGPELSGTTWRQWWLAWTATSGEHTIAVRAINKKGEVQTSTPKPSLPDGAQGWHTVQVSV